MFFFLKSISTAASKADVTIQVFSNYISYICPCAVVPQLAVRTCYIGSGS